MLFKAMCLTCDAMQATLERPESRSSVRALFTRREEVDWKQMSRTGEENRELKGVLFEEHHLGQQVLLSWTASQSSQSRVGTREWVRSANSALTQSPVLEWRLSVGTDLWLTSCWPLIATTFHSSKVFLTQLGAFPSIRSFRSPERWVTAFWGLSTVGLKPTINLNSND